MSDPTKSLAEPVATRGAVPDRKSGTAPRAPLPAGWRIALFLWMTSFAFLFLYEMLTSLFRLIAQAGGRPTP